MGASDLKDFLGRMKTILGDVGSVSGLAEVVTTAGEVEGQIDVQALSDAIDGLASSCASVKEAVDQGEEVCIMPMTAAYEACGHTVTALRKTAEVLNAGSKLTEGVGGLASNLF